MAQLFLAERTATLGGRRLVVLKSIHQQHVDDPPSRELFAHEPRIPMMLPHANIVQVYDCRSFGDSFILEMEYVDGVDVAKLLRHTRPVGFDLACTIVSDLLRALDYAHQRKSVDGEPLRIVHRDVSPGN